MLSLETRVFVPPIRYVKGYSDVVAVSELLAAAGRAGDQ